MKQELKQEKIDIKKTQRKKQQQPTEATSRENAKEGSGQAGKKDALMKLPSGSWAAGIKLKSKLNHKPFYI